MSFRHWLVLLIVCASCADSKADEPDCKLLTQSNILTSITDLEKENNLFTLPLGKIQISSGQHGYTFTKASGAAPGLCTNSLREHANPIQRKTVTNTRELLAALKQAKPGTQITLAPGHYAISSGAFRSFAAGQEKHPIVLKARHFGEVTLNINSVEGLIIRHSDWLIENLIFKGVCQHDSQCEHAIHIAGNADRVSIFNNRFINFNSHIKSNGEVVDDKRQFPDDVIIKNNDFLNLWSRDTLSATTPIDVVGGNDWYVGFNHIADFGSTSTDNNRASYGVFLKGGGQRGEIAHNVVICADQVPYQSPQDIRIGISLGGGGTGARYCQNQCAFEHELGKVHDNVVLNCQNDVSIYMNKATTAQVYNNLLLNSDGIDVRFKQSSVLVQDNILHGRIKSRNSARLRATDNQVLTDTSGTQW